ncbi:hypothetical protein ACHAP5_011396 [Fusarium lateritium]
MKLFWVEDLILHKDNHITFINTPLSLYHANRRVRHTATDVQILWPKEVLRHQPGPIMGCPWYNVDQ